MNLVTGFEPFTTGQGLMLTHNPTGDIAQRIGATLPDVQGAVLPVSFVATKNALLAKFEQVQPAHWIGLGFAPHRTTIDVEVVALNLEHATRGDNDGDTPSMRPILNDGPLAYRAKHDLEPLVRRLFGNSVPAQTHFHAGTFLCNQTFYLGCHRVELGLMQTATFIHVPPMDDYAPFTEALSAYLKSLSVNLSD